MIMVMYKYSDYQAAIALFFMSIVVIGNYMLLNLFLAILLKFISDKTEGDSGSRKSIYSDQDLPAIEAGKESPCR